MIDTVIIGASKGNNIDNMTILLIVITRKGISGVFSASMTELNASNVNFLAHYPGKS